jgi:hypothetical protein
MVHVDIKIHSYQILPDKISNFRICFHHESHLLDPLHHEGQIFSAILHLLKLHMLCLFLKTYHVPLGHPVKKYIIFKHFHLERILPEK